MTHDTMLSRVPSSVPQVLHDGLGELHEVPRRVQQPLARLRLHHLHQPVSLLYTIQIFSLYSHSIKKLRIFKIIRYIRIPDATNRADGGAPYTFTSPASLVSCDRCAGGSNMATMFMFIKQQIIQVCSEYCGNYPLTHLL